MSGQRKKMNDISYVLGHNIRKNRISCHLTQRDLAERLHVSPQAVSKWERGIALPDIDLIIPLADIFSVTLDELFGRDGYV